MESVELGRTGMRVSRMIFGAGSIGGVGSPPATRGLGLSAGQGLERLDEAYPPGDSRRRHR
ncbi:MULTISPECIES: hypothetical protein [Catenuloplanes]|uniref:Aryl-alcohol dehydrogenase-like predicted oxidoreductase n=1 Tax=Catenuloplanes niger TaxID=587534 RepID=A0AAE3ZZA5_9ACTN|nr:hypothetical protein [Catenuloplanes niger]MDR7327591.1 aryl-alcohol dehydrogenase-like predicted oxidoreductase [Catenuloplanes niger]